MFIYICLFYFISYFISIVVYLHWFLFVESPYETFHYRCGLVYHFFNCANEF
jgi:hypothetical protein